MFAWKSKTINPFSLMALCSKLTTIQEPGSTDAELVESIIDETFKEVKKKTKIAFYNTIIKVKLQSEEKPIKNLDLISLFLAECLGITSTVIIVNNGTNFKTISVSNSLQCSHIPLSEKMLTNHFEKTFNFLKLNVTSSDCQEELAKQIRIHLKLNQDVYIPSWSELKDDNTGKIKIIAFFFLDSKKAMFHNQ